MPAPVVAERIKRAEVDVAEICVASGARIMSWWGPGNGLVKVPWHPVAGGLQNLTRVGQQSREVVEGIDTGDPTGGNETHEEVPHPCSSKGLEEQRVLPMKDALLEHPFADVVIKGSTGDTQKERQGSPVFEHVFNGFAHGRIGLDTLLLQLVFEPLLETLHKRAAVFLVEGESVFG